MPQVHCFQAIQQLSQLTRNWQVPWWKDWNSVTYTINWHDSSKLLSGTVGTTVSKSSEEVNQSTACPTGLCILRTGFCPCGRGRTLHFRMHKILFDARIRWVIFNASQTLAVIQPHSRCTNELVIRYVWKRLVLGYPDPNPQSIRLSSTPGRVALGIAGQVIKECSSS